VQSVRYNDPLLQVAQGKTRQSQALTPGAWQAGPVHRDLRQDHSVLALGGKGGQLGILEDDAARAGDIHPGVHVDAVIPAAQDVLEGLRGQQNGQANNSQQGQRGQFDAQAPEGIKAVSSPDSPGGEAKAGGRNQNRQDGQ